MRTFEVIENRGYGITYVDFTGTLEACKLHINNLLDLQKNGDLLNGDGAPFNYTISEIVE